MQWKKTEMPLGQNTMQKFVVPPVPLIPDASSLGGCCCTRCIGRQGRPRVPPPCRLVEYDKGRGSRWTMDAHTDARDAIRCCGSLTLEGLILVGSGAPAA